MLSTNIRSMFLIFARPKECLRTPKNAYEQLRLSCAHCELAPNCIRKPIWQHFRLGVRAALEHLKHIFKLMVKRQSQKASSLVKWTFTNFYRILPECLNGSHLYNTERFGKQTSIISDVKLTCISFLICYRPIFPL